jgi:hypothetical protein
VTATFLVTIYAPLFYVLIESALGKRSMRQAAVSVEIPPSEVPTK